MRLLMMAVLLLAACSVEGPGFHCLASDECGPEGACEETGYCSFSDSSCSSGRRYGQFASALGSECVALPVDAGPCPDEIALGAGGDHTCVKTGNGGVVCAGANGHGQLGSGDFTGSWSPVAVMGVGSVAEVSIGVEHNCAVRSAGSGMIYCWGRNDHGQVGDGTTGDRPEAVRIPARGSRVVCGAEHTCLIDGGDVSCWGRGTEGQLGGGQTTDSPAPVVSGVTAAVGLAAGGRHSCAVQDDGDVWCWGANDAGQLGLGTFVGENLPVQTSIDDAVEVVAGDAHTCVRRQDGTVWCWGRGIEGQLGDGSGLGSATPVQVAGLSGARALAAGGMHTCAILDDDSLWCWGANGAGQVGGVGDAPSPRRVDAVTSARSVTAGESHTCAQALDSWIWCWGAGAAGQLGAGAGVVTGPAVYRLTRE